MLWALVLTCREIQTFRAESCECTRQAMLCAFGVSLYSEGIKFTGSYREMPLPLLPQYQRVAYPVGPHTRRWHWYHRKAAQGSVCVCQYARVRQWLGHHTPTAGGLGLISGWRAEMLRASPCARNLKPRMGLCSITHRP